MTADDTRRLMVVMSSGGSSAPPANTVPPQLSALEPGLGDPVTVTTGTWTGSPTSFAYLWQFGPSPAGAWTDVPSGTTNTYQAPNAYFRCRVTATNDTGSTIAYSDVAVGVDYS